MEKRLILCYDTFKDLSHGSESFMDKRTATAFLTRLGHDQRTGERSERSRGGGFRRNTSTDLSESGGTIWTTAYRSSSWTTRIWPGGFFEGLAPMSERYALAASFSMADQAVDWCLDHPTIWSS